MRRVRLVEVHVVHAQPLQALVHRVEDVLAREPGPERTVPHAPHHLGRDHDLLARQSGECLAEQRLGPAAHVDVGGVEQVDAELEGAAHDANRLGVLGVAAERGPRTERDLRDLETAVSERAVVHGGAP